MAHGTWTTDPDDQLYSVRDLDQTPLGRLSRRTRYRLVSNGDLPALTINGRHYVSKAAVIALLRRIEGVEVVARVPVPGARHARTGKYDGTKLVSLVDKAISRPRAITECGATATATDFSASCVRGDLRDGRATEMCRACRAKLETDFGWCDLSHLSDHSGSSTAKQRDLIHALNNEGAQEGCYRFNMAGHVLDQLSSREAAATINELRAYKTKGWKRLPYKRWSFGDTALNDLLATLPKGLGKRALHAICNCGITTLAQLNETAPHVVFSAKNVGVSVIKALLDAGVWPGVSLSSATRKYIIDTGGLPMVRVMMTARGPRAR